jgi:HK97 family phage major capsid protein
MSYKSELKGRRYIAAGTVRAFEGMLSAGEALSTRDRKTFDDAGDEIRYCDQQLSNLNSTDFRGMDGQKNLSEGDKGFTKYLRTGDTAGVELRSDGPGISTAPNDSGFSAGATGYDAGYLVPQGFWKNLQIAQKAYGGIANDMKQVKTASGQPMPWPSTDYTTVSASLLTGENNQLSLQNYYQFGQGMLNAWTIAAGPILASLQLINDSAFDVDGFVATAFGEAIGRELAALAMTGTGSSQPLGVIPALVARGAWSAGKSGGCVPLGTATVVKTLDGTNPTELVGNLLSATSYLNLVASVDPAYRYDADGNPTAVFYVNDAQLKGLRNIADGYGRPLLVLPSAGGPPTLWGFPVKVVPEIPNLTASTPGGPIFGNLQAAFVQRTVNSASVMRLSERYADYLAVGYIGYVRADIRSNDMRALATVTPAAT